MTDNANPNDTSTRGEQMRARLLAAAARVFAERGYEATRVSDINRAAETSHGNFYWHFKNKDEILVEVLRPTIDRMLDRARRGETWPDEMTDEIYAESVVQQLIIYKEYRELIRVMREAAARGSSGTFFKIWMDLRQQFIDRNESLLIELQRSGRLRDDVDPVEAAESGIAMVEQLAYVRIGLPDVAPSDDDVRRMAYQAGLIWYRGIIAEPTTT